MECVHCGTEGFDRVVVNPTTDEVNGGLCRSCECSEFGLLANEPVWRQEDGCGLCSADADFALPKADCVIEWDDGTEDVEYRITDSTLHLCRDHLHQVLDIADLEEAAQAPAIQSQA